MRKTGLVVAIAVLAMPMAGPSATARAAALEKGTLEIAPSLAFSHSSLSFRGDDGGSTTTLTGTGLIGLCLSDHVELEGGLLVDHRSLDSPGATSASATSLGVVGGVRVNLGRGRVLPFVHGAAGIATHSGNVSFGGQTSVVAPILGAGVRLRVGDAASINMGIDYQHDSAAFGLQDLSGNTVALAIGLSIFHRHAKP